MGGTPPGKIVADGYVQPMAGALRVSYGSSRVPSP
jgi:hypothetical protein